MILRRGIIVVVALLSLLLLLACSSSGYRDGTYFAEMPEFSESGWKDIVEVTIEKGQLVKIDWDAVYMDESIPIRKKQYSKSGLYGMLVEGAVGEWYDQATAAEQFVMENGIDTLVINWEGYTDAVTGCTIHVDAFDRLLRECLEQAEK